VKEMDLRFLIPATGRDVLLAVLNLHVFRMHRLQVVL